VEENKVKVVNVPGGYDCPAIDKKWRDCRRVGKRAKGDALRQKLQQQIAQFLRSREQAGAVYSQPRRNEYHGGRTQTAADGAIRAAGLQNAMQGFDHYRAMSQEGLSPARRIWW
jgi:iron complex transport system substrate-binding protein